MKLSRIEVFCAWGAGPDVVINIYHPDTGELHGTADLSADTARALAKQLEFAAKQSDDMDAHYRAYCEEG